MSSITIDTISGDGVLDNNEHTQSLTITGTTSGALDTARVNLTLNGNTYHTYLPPGSPNWSITIYPGDVEQLSSGTYTVHAQTFDQNINQISVDRTFVVSLPSVSISTILGDDVVNAADKQSPITLTGTAIGVDGQVVTVGLNGQTYQTTVVNGAWSVSLGHGAENALTDGTYTVTADVSDQYGNPATEATRTLTVHTTPPTVAIATIAGDDVINAAEHGAAVIVTGTATGAEGRTVMVGFGMQNYTATVANGTWSVTLPQSVVTGLADGIDSITADVTDAAGNAATQAFRNITVDTALPTVVISAVAGDDVVNASEHGAAVTVSGTASGANGGTVTVGLNGHTYTTSVANNAWTVTVPQGDVAGLTDGSFTVTAAATDLYGNTAIPVTRSLLVDTALPTITIPTIAGDNAINAAEHGSSLVVSGGQTSGPSVTVGLNGQSYAATIVSGTWFVTIAQAAVAALTNGHYTITAQATDAYGNVNTASTALLVDTTPPALTISTIAGDDVINAVEHGSAVVLAGTATGADGQTVTVNLNGETYTAVVANGTWMATVPQADVSDMEDGVFTVNASVSDAYGNGQATASRSLLVATSVPQITLSAITGDDILNAAAHAAALTLSGTAIGAGGDTVTVSLAGRSYSALVLHGLWSVIIPQGQVSALPDGAVTVTASVTDTHGNTSIPATRSLVVAATPPTVSIATISSDDALNASDATAALTLSGVATGAEGRSVTVSLNNHSYAATVVNGHWSLSVPQADIGALADRQSYNITANVTDQYGNAATPATHSLLVATTVPSITVDTIGGDGVINATEHGAALSLSGTATIPEGNGTGPVTVTLNASTYTTTVSNGVWTLTVPQGDVAALGDGAFSVVATVSDAYGNSATSAPRGVLVDTTMPTVTIGTIAADDRINATEHEAALTIDGTSADDAGGTVTLGLAGHVYSTTAGSDGSWSVTVPQADVGGLADGSYLVTASVTNGIGNQSVTANHPLLVDTVALAPWVALVPGSTATNISLMGTAEANALISLSLDGQNVGTTTAATDGTWHYALTGTIPDGPDTVTATQTDLAGNISAASHAVALPRAATDFATSDPDFDAAWYLAQNPDVAATGMDPLQHYENFGWKEGRDPNPLFNVTYYLNQNPDVAASGMDPLQQYEDFGWKEGRDPSIDFSTNAYLAANPDVAAVGMDPLLNYLHFGQAEGRMIFTATPHVTGPQDPLVDANDYYANNPAVAAAGLDPTAQFDSVGWQQGANPDPYFDVAYYLANNPDVAAAGVNPLLQYELYGWQEGRNPSASFSTNGYLAANPDVAAAHIDPLLQYIAYGQAEGRSIVPV